MSCNSINSGYQFGCSDVSVGGVKWFGLTEQTNISSTGSDSGNTLTAVTFTVSGTTFFKYDVRGTSTATDTNTNSPENETSMSEQAITMILNKSDSTKRNQVKAMKGKNLAILVAYEDGTYRLFGASRGLRMLTAANASGTALADRNGYEINFAGQELDIAPFVSSAIIASITSY
jgi:hypothetical protein